MNYSMTWNIRKKKCEYIGLNAQCTNTVHFISALGSSYTCLTTQNDTPLWIVIVSSNGTEMK